MDLGLKNKVALVVASSQGLGKAVAKELVKEGAHVMLTSRSEDKLAEVKEELEAMHAGKVAYFPCDITKVEDIQKLVARTHTVFGKIDILLNNAGGPPSGKFDSFSDEVWQQPIELNLLSYIRIIREVLPDLRKEGGRIVNIASVIGVTGNAGQANYAASKAGLIGLAQAWAPQLQARGISINAVAPGFIETQMTAHIPFALREAGRRMSSLGQGGQPQDVAEAVAWLGQPGSGAVSGQALRVCGQSILGA